MRKERFLDKAENFLDFAANSFTEAVFFKPQESVGTIKVMDSFRDRKYFPGFDMVILDIGGLTELDESAVIYRVPRGLIKEDQMAEVIVKKAKFKTEPESWLTAIRPFDRQTFGKPFTSKESELSAMFSYNLKNADGARRFFKKFFSDRLRTEPPFVF